MAPRGRRKKAGMMREDAARDAMKNYGFVESVIKESIKELLNVYGEVSEDIWRLFEEERYEGLREICLEKQAQHNQMIVKQQEEKAQEDEEDEEDPQEEEEEQQLPVEDGRDLVDNNSTSIVECVNERETQPCLTDEYSIPSDTIMDSSPSPLPSLVGEESADYAHQSVEGAKNSRCGWISSEEEMEEEEDDDDEMIQLTPEPLCEELEELLREVRGREQKKRKRDSRWDK